MLTDCDVEAKHKLPDTILLKKTVLEGVGGA